MWTMPEKKAKVSRATGAFYVKAAIGACHRGHKGVDDRLSLESDNDIKEKCKLLPKS